MPNRSHQHFMKTTPPKNPKTLAAIPLLMVLSCLLVANCMRPMPPHLDPSTNISPSDDTLSFDKLESTLSYMVAHDPLVRMPKLPNVAQLGLWAKDAGILDYVDRVQAVEIQLADATTLFQELEEKRAYTITVPLSRGYRLHLADSLMSGSGREENQTETTLYTMSLVSFLAPSGPRPMTLGTQSPLWWLGPTEQHHRALQNYGDQWVLASWLADPSFPLDSVGKALEHPIADRLRLSPVGTLIHRRASESSPSAPQTAFEDLIQATFLGLTQAAADRDGEQGAWADLKREVSHELGTQDPIGFLLARTIKTLSAHGSDDKAVGGALLAIAAGRWHGSCPQQPCLGLDRVEMMGHAGRWDEEIDALARIWHAIALKESLDAMDVGHNTVLFPHSMLNLLDSLGATNTGLLQAALLTHQSPSPLLWETLGRSLGKERCTDWLSVKQPLGVHLQEMVINALLYPHPDATQRLLSRIQERAIP